MTKRRFFSKRHTVPPLIRKAQKAVARTITVISPRDVPKLYNIIIEAISTPQGWIIKDMAHQIEQEFGIESAQAMTLALTESNRIATITREIQAKANSPPYALYTWGGADDRRTTPICREIKERVNLEGGGVSLDRLKEIVREVGTAHALRDGQAPPLADWAPHANCRHTFRRVWL